MDVLSYSLSVTKAKSYTDTKVEALPQGLLYQGSVTKASELPTTGNEPGYTYTDESTGHQWVWDGTKWIDLSKDLDNKVDKIPGKGLSTNDYVAADHYTNEEIEALVGDGKVYNVTKGTTTLAQIKNAYDNGYIVIMRDSDKLFTLSHCNSTLAAFTAVVITSSERKIYFCSVSATAWNTVDSIVIPAAASVIETETEYILKL